MTKRHELTDAERDDLDQKGFLVRERVFDESETTILSEICEQLIDRMQHKASNPFWEMGSYLFEIDRQLETVIKWERENPSTILGIEPVAHLDERIALWASDLRFRQPMADLIGVDDVELYTEKLNVKRARVGGPIVTHQDYPYWARVSDDVEKIGTAVLFLDDADMTNGCLEAWPGSHKLGIQPYKQATGFASNEIDESEIDLSRLVPLPVPKGSVIFFGPRLVHRSLHNRSDQDRKALLFSYQPSGFAHSRSYIDLTKVPEAI